MSLSFNHKSEIVIGHLADYRMAELVAARLHEHFKDKDKCNFAGKGYSFMISSGVDRRARLYICNTKTREPSLQAVSTARALAKNYVGILLPFFPKVKADKAFATVIQIGL